MMSPTNSRAQLIAAAQDLFQTLNGVWSESDADRRVPHRVVEEMRSAGLFRMVVPSELGGAEADLQTFLDVLHLVAYANGSGGWDLATSSMGSLFALGLPAEGIEQIYGGGPDVILAGTITLDRDAAEAIATNGGYRISGRWRFGSGCQDADWMMASAAVFEHEQPRIDADGAPEFRYAVFPRKTVDIIDTWHVLGMRGTGSHDWSVHNAFVPEGLTENARAVAQMLRPRPWRGALYRVPLFVIASLHFSAVATGLARRAIDTLVDLANSKTPHRSSALLRARVQVQEAVARAEVELESARAYRDRIVEDTWKTVERGGSLTLEQRARAAGWDARRGERGESGRPDVWLRRHDLHSRCLRAFALLPRRARGRPEHHRAPPPLRGHRTCLPWYGAGGVNPTLEVTSKKDDWFGKAEPPR